MVVTERPARFQTAADKTKALRQYEALKRSNMVVKAVVIAELKDGTFHVLGQELTPTEIAPLLLVGSEALVSADADRKIVKLVSRVEPEKRGEHNRQRAREREIKTAADGTLVAPPGENFISCGECNHPEWSVTHHNEDDTHARMACSHCGNEVKALRVTHEGGHA